MEHLYDEEDDANAALRTKGGSYDRLIRKLRKSVIIAFSSRSKQSKNFKTSILISMGLAFISAVQGMSLVLLRHDTISEYESLEKVFVMINYARLDTLAFDTGQIYAFFYGGLAFVYLPVVLLIGNVALVFYWKKKPIAIAVQLMSVSLTLIEQILLVPALVLMISFIKYTYISSDATMLEYGDSPDLLNSPGMAAVSIVTLPLLVGVLYFNSYFFYDSVFAKRRKLVYSMSDSFVHRIHVVARVFMVLCYSFLSSFSLIWFRIGIMILCAFMFMLYHQRQSYFNPIINLENCSKKATIVWTVVAYLVGEATDSSAAIVLLILFVSPLIIALIYFRTLEYMKVITKQRLADITFAYQVELKLRVYLEELELCNPEDRDAIHKKVENLFTFATTHFTKAPLLYVWEAYYYYHYRSSVFLALLKLSKVHFTDQTLESQFFMSKAADKFLAIEDSPERLYLRFLKLLDEAKHSDEFCCLQLVSMCSELLGRKLDSSRFENFVQKLSAEINKTTKKYFKILTLYNDNEEVLKLLGSFMCDIMKEAEGRNFVVRAGMMRSGDIRKATVSINGGVNLFNDELGLVILQCTVDMPGFVVLCNPKAYEIYKSGSVDAMKKSYSAYIPKEFNPIFASSITEFITFGTWIDSINQMFRLCLDGEGYLMCVNMGVKITTWDYKTHIVLLVTEMQHCEVVAVDETYQIRAHSRLTAVLIQEQSVMYAGCSLDSVFPGLSERLKTEGRNFVFEHANHSSSRVSVESVDFRDVHLRLIVFKVSNELHFSSALRSQDQSLNETLVADNRRGVRFNSGVPAAVPEQHDLRLMSLQEQPNTSAIYSQTEAKIKRKFDLTASITTSNTSSSDAFEVQEGLKVSKSLKRMKLLVVTAILLLVAGLVTSVVFVAEILNSLKSITTINQFNQRSLEALQLAYDVRSLMLSDNSSYPYDHDTLVANIQSHSDNLNTITNYMKSLVGQQASADDIYMLEATVPMWEKIENKYQFTMMTLLDALYETTAQAEALTTMSPPYLDLSESFFIYRNSAGDLLNIGNLTLVIQVKADQETRMQSLLVIDYLLYMCAILIVLPLLLLVGPQLYFFELQNRGIWGSIYSLPLSLILEVRNTALDRLQNYFNNEFQLDASISAKKVEQAVTPARVWPKLVLKISIYLLANAVFFITLEVGFFMPVNDLAVTIPNYMYWSGLRQKLLTEGMFWARELCLEDTPALSYKTLVPEGELWYSPSERTANTSTSLAFIGYVLNFGDPQAGVSTIKKSEAYLDFLLSDACSQLQVADCEISEAGLGQTYLLREWSQSVNWIAAERDYSLNMNESMKDFEVQVNLSVTAVGYSTDFYQNDAITQIDLISMQIVTLTVSFICFLFLLYIGLYSPTINALLSKERQALKIHKLLRSK